MLLKKITKDSKHLLCHTHAVSHVIGTGLKIASSPSSEVPSRGTQSAQRPLQGRHIRCEAFPSIFCCPTGHVDAPPRLHFRCAGSPAVADRAKVCVKPNFFLNIRGKQTSPCCPAYATIRLNRVRLNWSLQYVVYAWALDLNGQRPHENQKPTVIAL